MKYLVISLLLFFTVFQCIAKEESKLYKMSNGELSYIEDSLGNVIPDFSYVGYKTTGESDIPDPDVKIRLQPLADGVDNRSQILAAISQLGNLPLDTDGFRGTLLLEAGEYHVSGPIQINASGIVIRGEGKDKTTVIATRRSRHDLFSFRGKGAPLEVGVESNIIEPVPIGDKEFEIESNHGLVVGDTIFVIRKPQQKWLTKLGTAHIWNIDDMVTKYKRTVVGMKGNVITLDAPIVDSIDGKAALGSVVKYTWQDKIYQVGIEDMTLISEYAHANDNSHAWSAVEMNFVQDAWIRNIDAYHFAYATANLGAEAYRVSVINSASYDPVSVIEGSMRYSFAVRGQLVLVKDSFSENGRHDFVSNTGAAGPNAFVNCEATGQIEASGPYHRWSTGTLYDNFKGDGTLETIYRSRNRPLAGWTGGQIMFWNSQANQINIETPKGHRNWSIGNIVSGGAGSIERIDRNTRIESSNKNVWPQSLYEQQLQDRLSN